MKIDFFICHASEDKDIVARPLATMLQDIGCSVWFDEFSLKPGDSLVEKIDHGLANCRFGVVVLSPAFFKKQWTQREFKGLVSRQIQESKTIIIPIWYDISLADILRHSPPLGDVVALKHELGTPVLASRLRALLDEVTTNITEMLGHKVLIQPGDNPVAHLFLSRTIRALESISEFRVSNISATGQLELIRARGGQTELITDGTSSTLIWRFSPPKEAGDLFFISALFLLRDSYADEEDTSSTLILRSTESLKHVVQFPQTRKVRNVAATQMLRGVERDCANFIYEDRTKRAMLLDSFPEIGSRYRISWTWEPL